MSGLLDLGAFSLELKVPTETLGGWLSVRVVSLRAGAQPISREHLLEAVKLLEALADCGLRLPGAAGALPLEHPEVLSWFCTGCGMQWDLHAARPCTCTRAGHPNQSAPDWLRGRVWQPEWNGVNGVRFLRLGPEIRQCTTCLRTWRPGEIRPCTCNPPPLPTDDGPRE